jgi:hypothetical protein
MRLSLGSLSICLSCTALYDNVRGTACSAVCLLAGRVSFAGVFVPMTFT